MLLYKVLRYCDLNQYTIVILTQSITVIAHIQTHVRLNNYIETKSLFIYSNNPIKINSMP